MVNLLSVNQSLFCVCSNVSKGEPGVLSTLHLSFIHDCNHLALIDQFAATAKLTSAASPSLRQHTMFSVSKLGMTHVCHRMSTTMAPWRITLQILQRDDGYKDRLPEASRHASTLKRNKQPHTSNQNSQTQSSLTAFNPHIIISSIIIQ